MERVLTQIAQSWTKLQVRIFQGKHAQNALACLAAFEAQGMVIKAQLTAKGWHLWGFRNQSCGNNEEHKNSNPYSKVSSRNIFTKHRFQGVFVEIRILLQKLASACDTLPNLRCQQKT